MEIAISHVRSDFDALASTVAASKLYPGALPILQESLEGSVRQFVGLYKDLLGLKHLDEIDLAAVTRVIVVDTAQLDRLGTQAALLQRPEVEWVVFDHHPAEADDLPTGKGRRARTGAATTMLVQELAKNDVPVTSLEATAMALGIYADTGNLLFPSTRAEDATAVAWLLGRGAQLDVIARFCEEALDKAQQALLQELLAHGFAENLRGYQVLLVGARAPDYVEGMALVVHKLLGILDVDIAVVVVEMGKRTQIVARGRLEGFDLRTLLMDFDVHGHPLACSAHGNQIPVEEALETIRGRVAVALPPEPVASDLMSAPVRTVGPREQVGEVRALLGRYGHTALLVMDGDRLEGIISRRDLDRASLHGLTDAPVAEVMTRRVFTAPPEMPLSELEALVMGRDVGRVPIVHKGAVVGIVTRSDLLRVRTERIHGEDHATRPALSEWSRRLHALWPATWLELLARVGQIAGDRPLYLVGGAVRDLLLERPNLDVDLVVEGDAIALAREVAIALEAETPGIKLTAHAPFGTAQISLGDGRKLDFASARTEYYTHPAALPTVEFSSIKQDLARRDFSVNALALRVDPGHFGELLDFFGGRSDLEAGILRVLHNLSFVDDPTRLLRGVRFEDQLGFTLALETESYAKFAMGSGRFDNLRGERIKQELRRLLLRPDPSKEARRLASLDAWRMIHEELLPDQGTWRDLRRLRRVLRLAGLGADPLRWLVYLARILRPLSLTEVEAVLAKLHLGGAEARVVTDALDLANRLLDAGEVLALAPVDLVLSLKTGPEVLLAFLATEAASRAQRRVLVRYWREWRPLKLTVDGNDLKALGLPPGPGYARILREVLNARLSGVVRTPFEERMLLERLATEAPERQKG